MKKMKGCGRKIGPYEFRPVWSMPNSNTFEVGPIGEFVQRYIRESAVSVDPFARNNQWATFTNDLSPDTLAESHLDAEEFLSGLAQKGVAADLVIFDPPYSPRQISECYKSIGRTVGMEETQNAKLYSRVRDAILPVLTVGGIVLSFGWNSVGMGIGRGFEIGEILMVCHGAAHNDTICIAEERIALVEMQPTLFEKHKPEQPALT